jgi:hypothetical protein
MRVRDGPTHNYIVTKSHEPITSFAGVTGFYNEKVR